MGELAPAIHRIGFSPLPGGPNQSTHPPDFFMAAPEALGSHSLAKHHPSGNAALAYAANASEIASLGFYGP